VAKLTCKEDDVIICLFSLWKEVAMPKTESGEEIPQPAMHEVFVKSNLAKSVALDQEIQIAFPTLRYETKFKRIVERQYKMLLQQEVFQSLGQLLRARRLKKHEAIKPLNCHPSGFVRNLKNGAVDPVLFDKFIESLGFTAQDYKLFISDEELLKARLHGVAMPELQYRAMTALLPHHLRILEAYPDPLPLYQVVILRQLVYTGTRGLKTSWRRFVKRRPAFQEQELLDSLYPELEQLREQVSEQLEPYPAEYEQLASWLDVDVQEFLLLAIKLWNEWGKELIVVDEIMHDYFHDPAFDRRWLQIAVAK
jgi:hypothetical protein